MCSVLPMLAAGSAAVAAGADEAACPAERAVYTLNSDPAFTAGFVPSKHFASMASNLYFRVTSPQRSYWFTFDVSNGYGGIALGPVGDPYIAAEGDPDNGPASIVPDEASQGQLRVYPMRRDLTVLYNPPLSGEPAPDAIFAPELGNILWYSPRDVTLDDAAQRDPMTRGVFIRSGCLDAAPEAGYP